MKTLTLTTLALLAGLLSMGSHYVPNIINDASYTLTADGDWPATDDWEYGQRSVEFKPVAR